jgi:hypothetical protein
MKTWVQSQAWTSGICDGHSATGTSFSASASNSPRQYHSTNVPRTHARTHTHAHTSILATGSIVNPLKAELNPICYLLVLLGDLTFMGPCITSIFQYISNKMQRYTVY